MNEICFKSKIKNVANHQLFNWKIFHSFKTFQVSITLATWLTYCSISIEWNILRNEFDLNMCAKHEPKALHFGRQNGRKLLPLLLWLMAWHTRRFHFFFVGKWKVKRSQETHVDFHAPQKYPPKKSAQKNLPSEEPTSEFSSTLFWGRNIKGDACLMGQLTSAFRVLTYCH